MSALVAFEVQSLQNGSWKIEAIVDSKDFAVHTAEQVIKNRAVTKVRVVQETVEEDSSRPKTRVVFLRDKYAGKTSKAPEKPAPKMETVPPPPPAAAPRKPWSKTAIGLTVNFGAIVVVGVAIILALRYFAET